MVGEPNAKLTGAVSEAREAVHRLNRILMANVSSHWIHMDLSMAQIKAMFVLDEVEGLTVSGLAEKLGTKPSATSILVDRLVHQGLVKRVEDENDRRRVLLSLTEESQSLLERLRQGRARLGQRIEELITALSIEEIESLTVGVRALVRVAEAHLASDPDRCEAMSETDTPPGSPA